MGSATTHNNPVDNLIQGTRIFNLAIIWYRSEFEVFSSAIEMSNSAIGKSSSAIRTASKSRALVGLDSRGL